MGCDIIPKDFAAIFISKICLFCSFICKKVENFIWNDLGIGKDEATQENMDSYTESEVLDTEDWEILVERNSFSVILY